MSHVDISPINTANGIAMHRFVSIRDAIDDLKCWDWYASVFSVRDELDCIQGRIRGKWFRLTLSTNARTESGRTLLSEIVTPQMKTSLAHGVALT